jgi:hypothetical protein
VIGEAQRNKQHSLPLTSSEFSPVIATESEYFITGPYDEGESLRWGTMTVAAGPK